jgi:hypothetical protein
MASRATLTPFSSATFLKLFDQREVAVGLLSLEHGLRVRKSAELDALLPVATDEAVRQHPVRGNAKLPAGGEDVCLDAAHVVARNKLWNESPSERKMPLGG